MHIPAMGKFVVLAGKLFASDTETTQLRRVGEPLFFYPNQPFGKALAGVSATTGRRGSFPALGLTDKRSIPAARFEDCGLSLFETMDFCGPVYRHLQHRGSNSAGRPLPFWGFQ